MLLRRLSRLWPDQALDGADPLLEAALGRRAEARLQPLDVNFNFNFLSNYDFKSSFVFRFLSVLSNHISQLR